MVAGRLPLHVDQPTRSKVVSSLHEARTKALLGSQSNSGLQHVPLTICLLSKPPKFDSLARQGGGVLTATLFDRQDRVGRPSGPS